MLCLRFCCLMYAQTDRTLLIKLRGKRCVGDQSNNNSGGLGCLKAHTVMKHNDGKWTVEKTGAGTKTP
jgi:hypothetical protein